MIVFENKGILPLECISTFGVSIKENENAFGYFGTGLKYAIAILLRNKQCITILAGKKKYTFTTEKRTVRGKDFLFILMNGKSLNFTTEVGKDWKIWQCYRELYCNCMDEKGGRVRQASEAPNPSENTTYIIVEGSKFELVFLKAGTIVLTSKPLFQSLYPSLEIHNGASKSLYYKTIKAYELETRPAMFTYNITSNISLTEDRTIKSLEDAFDKIMRVIMYSEEKDFIRKVITARDGYLEHSFNYRLPCATPSTTFFEVVKEEIQRANPELNLSAMGLYNKYEKDKAEPTAIKSIPEMIQLRLNKAIDFCKKINYPVDDYPIIITSSMVTETLGLALNGKIFLAQHLFDKGTNIVAQALIEEYVHLHYNYEDMSRPLQTYLFETIVSFGEQLTQDLL